MHPDVLLAAVGGQTGELRDDPFTGVDGDLLAALSEQASAMSWRGQVTLLEGAEMAWALRVEVAPPIATVTSGDRSWSTPSSLVPLIVARCCGLGVRKRSPAGPIDVAWDEVRSGTIDGAERTLLLEPDELAPTAIVQLESGTLLVGMDADGSGDCLLIPQTGTEVWCHLIEALATPLADDLLEALAGAPGRDLPEGDPPGDDPPDGDWPTA